MEIDIISYTPAQYAKLTEEQILKVQAAQLKKNKLEKELTENLNKEKCNLIKNGTLISGMWNKIQNKLRTACMQEVEALRDELLFYLQYSFKPSEGESSSAPYLVDYSLSMEERLDIVRTYYENSYTDSQARINAFKADDVAVQYLGELYAPLYDYILTL